MHRRDNGGCNTNAHSGIEPDIDAEPDFLFVRTGLHVCELVVRSEPHETSVIRGEPRVVAGRYVIETVRRDLSDSRCGGENQRRENDEREQPETVQVFLLGRATATIVVPQKGRGGGRIWAAD